MNNSKLFKDLVGIQRKTEKLWRTEEYVIISYSSTEGFHVYRGLKFLAGENQISHKDRDSSEMPHELFFFDSVSNERFFQILNDDEYADYCDNIVVDYQI